MSPRSTRVFAIVDQDFGVSNQTQWATMLNAADSHRYVLPVHEIENLMIDAESMATCGLNNLNRSVFDIDRKLHAQATELVSYMACRKTVTEMRHFVLDEFIGDLKQSQIANLAAAERIICESNWFQRASTQFAQLDEQWVHIRLADFESQYQNALTTDRWKEAFSGKEIVRSVCGYFYDVGPQAKIVRNRNVAQALARRQRETRRLHPCVTELRRALRQRIGL